MTNKISTQRHLCPTCGSKGKEIVYGRPNEDDSEKDFYFAGCIVSDDDWKYFCEACNEGFGK